MKFETFINDNIITESIEDKGIFKAAFFGGQSGAGKSYVLKKITSGQIEPRIVNVDTWIEHLHAEYDTPEHNKSKILTMSQLYLYVNSCLPLFIDSTSTNQLQVIKRYNILENIGYDLAMVWINVSLETSLNRVKIRNEKGLRIVPLAAAEKYYYKSLEVKSFLKNKFPIFYEIDNDDGKLTDDIVIEAFRKLTGFFNSPITNPIGIENVNKMKASGYKYLSELISEQKLKSIMRDWYSK